MTTVAPDHGAVHVSVTDRSARAALCSVLTPTQARDVADELVAIADELDAEAHAKAEAEKAAAEHHEPPHAA